MSSSSGKKPSSWTLLACHFSSLSLVSCRSRAEALARRLRTKLESTLGQTHEEEEAEEGKGANNSPAMMINGLWHQASPREGATETMHLLQQQSNHHHHQQQEKVKSTLLRDEEELFYDFDLASPLDHQHVTSGFFIAQDMGPACTRQPRPNGGIDSSYPFFPSKWSPTTDDDARESAYFSGGELDGRGVLEQGHREEAYGKLFNVGGTTLALVDTSSEDEAEDEEVFSECRECADDDEEVDADSWKEALAYDGVVLSPSPILTNGVARTTTLAESNGKDNTSPISNQQNLKSEKTLNGGHKCSVEELLFEMNMPTQDDKIVANHSQPQTTKKQVEIKAESCSAPAEDCEIPINDCQKVRNLMSIVKDEVSAAIHIIDTTENEDKDICFDETEGLDKCYKMNMHSTTNKQADNTDYPVNGNHPSVTSMHDSDCMFELEDILSEKMDDESKNTCLLPYADGKGNDTAVKDTVIESCEDDIEKEEDDDEADEALLHSPTWGMLKQIDRFQVRQLVKDCEEAPSNGEDDSPVPEDNNQVLATATELETQPTIHIERAENLDHKAKSNQETSLEAVSAIPSPIHVQSDPSQADDNTEIRARKISRSSSLKTGKTPPSTPGLKKIVRFADVLGLDLEDIRHVFLEDLPTVPPSAYEDLDAKQLSAQEPSCCPAPATANSTTEPVSIPGAAASNRAPTKNLIAMFSQPKNLPNFAQRVREQKVHLENATFTESAVRGHVRVLNMAFRKAVHVRYTLNEWRSYFDLEAVYLPGSAQDGETERFAFCIFGGDSLDVGERLVFCVRYNATDQEFWDNNHGNNYFFQCIQESVPLPPSPVDNWIHFL